MGGERGVEEGSGHKAEGPKLGKVTKVWRFLTSAMVDSQEERVGAGSLGPTPAPGLSVLPLSGPILGPRLFCATVGRGSILPILLLCRGWSSCSPQVGQLPNPCLGGSLGVPRAGG